MVADNTKLIRIDLSQFKLHLNLRPGVELTLHFNSPSRKFYLSVIGLVVCEMKKRGKIISIPLGKHLDVLSLLNETVGSSAGSSKKEHLLPRIYLKWKNALPDLENAPLFKVVGRKKRYDEVMDKVYGFSEREKDRWANLFEYKGSHEQVRLRFSIDRLGASLDDVIIVYGESTEREIVDVWDGFIAHLKEKLEDQSRPERAYREPKMPESKHFRLWGWPQVIRGKWKLPVLSALIGIILCATVFAVWNYKLFAPKIEVASIEKMAFPLPEKPSIAVLPFRNLSDDPKDYFSDGLTEEMINGLSKIPYLFVISANSMLTYKEKPLEIRQVAEGLGVRFVLSGSVRKDKDRLRITAQLIDAVDGRYLWTESYDRELKDIFSIQDEITIKILTALQIKLLASEKSILQEKQTDNLQAYLKIFEGHSYLYDFDINRSLRCFQEARTLDPQFAGAYAYEAFAYLHLFWFGPKSSRWQSLIKANETAKKCTELDDELGVCNMVLGVAYLMSGFPSSAVTEGKRAVERCPNSALAATFMALTMQKLGRYEEALWEIEKALRLNPFDSPFTMNILALTYFNMGQYEESIEVCKKVIEPFPRNLPAHMVLALTYGFDGRMAEARTVVYNILKIRPNFTAEDFVMLGLRKTCKDIDSIFGGLLKACSK